MVLFAKDIVDAELWYYLDMEKEKKIVIHVRAIILNDGKLLAVRHPHDTSFAALPGGHLEWGYTIVEDHPTMDVGYDGLLVFKS